MSTSGKYDIVIVGGGIFGVSSAIELARRNHKVAILNPDTIPHHLASSTDISKAVRMEYGSDREYHRMAELSIEKWHDWNHILGEEVYHEVGFLMLCKESIESEYQSFEKCSIENLAQAGYPSERLGVLGLKEKFPVVNVDNYPEGSFNPKGGYAESGRAVELLAKYAASIGVVIHEHQTVSSILIDDGQCNGVETKEGRLFHCQQVIVAAGTNTPLLVPEIQPFVKSTGHSVFWLKPSEPKRFTPPRFSVFTADISNTGWYGFPLHPRQGVVKIGKHSKGDAIHPEQDDRIVRADEIEDLRSFLESTFPELRNAPLVCTRKCLYTDTMDGHFWIDRHPEVQGLIVCTGGSGHGFKMGPIIGEITADTVEDKEHEFAARYKWRHLTADTIQMEEARNV